MSTALLTGTCVYFIGKISRAYWKKNEKIQGGANNNQAEKNLPQSITNSNNNQLQRRDQGSIAALQIQNSPVTPAHDDLNNTANDESMQLETSPREIEMQKP